MSNRSGSQADDDAMAPFLQSFRIMEFADIGYGGTYTFSESKIIVQAVDEGHHNARGHCKGIEPYPVYR